MAENPEHEDQAATNGAEGESVDAWAAVDALDDKPGEDAQAVISSNYDALLAAVLDVYRDDPDVAEASTIDSAEGTLDFSVAVAEVPIDEWLRTVRQHLRDRQQLSLVDDREGPGVRADDSLDLGPPRSSE